MGKPSKGTPKDMRLARNNPNAGRRSTKSAPAKKPFPGAAPPFTKKGG